MWMHGGLRTQEESLGRMMLILLSGRSQAGCQRGLGVRPNQQKMGRTPCPGILDIGSSLIRSSPTWAEE